MIAVARGVDRFDGRAAFMMWLYWGGDECRARRGPSQSAASTPGRPAGGGGGGWLHPRTRSAPASTSTLPSVTCPRSSVWRWSSRPGRARRRHRRRRAPAPVREQLDEAPSSSRATPPRCLERALAGSPAPTVYADRYPSGPARARAGPPGEGRPLHARAARHDDVPGGDRSSTSPESSRPPAGTLAGFSDGTRSHERLDDRRGRQHRTGRHDRPRQDGHPRSERHPGRGVRAAHRLSSSSPP